MGVPSGWENDYHGEGGKPVPKELTSLSAQRKGARPYNGRDQTQKTRGEIPLLHKKKRFWRRDHMLNARWGRGALKGGVSSGDLKGGFLYGIKGPIDLMGKGRQIIYGG